MPSVKPRYDVIVLGGGPAGAAAAIALAGKGVSVALFVRRRGEIPPVGETVPPPIMRPLVRLGLWETFVAARHRSSPGTVVIWGSETPYENEFIASPYGAGWHLDRKRFDDMLLCAARAAGAEVHLSIRIADCRRDCENEHWAITVSGNGAPAILAPWIIDATGRASWFARRQGVKRHSLDRLVAMVRFGSLDSTDDRTFIEARPEGWWYAAGLPGNRVAIAFFTDADLMSPRHTGHWDGLLEDTEHVSRIMASACDLSAVHIAAASSAYLSQFTGSGWVAIGDAAQSHDPCSGQGITKALESGLAAAEAIMAYRSGDRRAMDKFRAFATRAFQKFMGRRHAHYRKETRWPGHPFWQRRRGMP